MRSIQWKLPSPRRLLNSINLLRLTWVLLFFYVEQHIYNRAIKSCSWPFEAPKECRLAVIADPQIIDENTYPRRGLAMWLTKVFTDRYMRRNYKLLMEQDPGTTIFLGDLMDGGREWEDKKWIPEYKRFRKVFPPVEGVRMITTIPGNHDIGLGDGIQLPQLNRFKEYFTEENSTSQRFETCNFEILLLDTPSMLNTHDPDISEPPSLFLDEIPERKESVSRILFTHIPLFRPEDTGCGPFRESSRPIRLGGGYQYQNTLPQDITTRILDAVWPLNAIFSGDDHDYCLVEHGMEGRREKVPEYTVKSFSWAMGVKYPGYHLLSLVHSESQTASLETKLCLLPSPVDGFKAYGVMTCISVIWIIAIHCIRWRREEKVEYIELDNLWKDEENGGVKGKTVWRWDIHGMAKDVVYLFAFIAIGFIMQIFQIY